jgi:prophage DNA circulation protein
MTWEDRLKSLVVITTPDGKSHSFEYEDLEKLLEKKTSGYFFGDTPGELIQDFGEGKLSFPLLVYISGPDYDEAANEFDKSAALAGLCTLEHPLYGIHDINILGFRRQDLVKSAGGQAVYNITVNKTIIETAPVSGEETALGILTTMDDLAGANAAGFADGFDASFISDAIAAKDRVTAFVSDLKSNFQEILNTVQSVQDTFNEIQDYINNNIDFLLSAPLLLAAAVTNLINTPARIAASISSRISAYTSSYEKLLGATQGSGTTDAKNQRQEKQLLTIAIISAISEANLFADSDGVGFLTKSDALENAEILTDQLVSNQEFLDTEEQASLADSLEERFVVNDAVSQEIKDVVANTASNLKTLSFSLLQERIIVLERPRTIIDLCYQLYETTSNDKLDFLIETNTLTGKEIIEIPIGREVKYYV